MTDQTQSANETTMISLLNDLATLSQAAKSVREKLLKIVPVKYGSDLWWEKETEKSLEDYKQGKYKVYNNAKDLVNDLHNGV